MAKFGNIQLVQKIEKDEKSVNILNVQVNCPVNENIWNKLRIQAIKTKY